jgi:hypothetical protein
MGRSVIVFLHEIKLITGLYRYGRSRGFVGVDLLDGAGQVWLKWEAFCPNRKLMIDFHFPFRIIAYLDMLYRMFFVPVSLFI